MARKFIDCREVPSDKQCSVAISADSEAELVEAAVQHAIAAHGHEDTLELRNSIRNAIHTGSPPTEYPPQQYS